MVEIPDDDSCKMALTMKLSRTVQGEVGDR